MASRFNIDPYLRPAPTASLRDIAPQVEDELIQQEMRDSLVADRMAQRGAAVGFPGTDTSAVRDVFSTKPDIALPPADIRRNDVTPFVTGVDRSSPDLNRGPGGVRGLLSKILPYVIAAGKGAQSVENQRFPDLIGSIGAAAQAAQQEDAFRAQQEREQRRFESEEDERRQRLKSDIATADVKRRKSESEARMGEMEAAQYNEALGLGRRKEEEAILSSQADRAYKEVRADLERAGMLSGIRVKDAQAIRIGVEARLLEERLSQGYPYYQAKAMAAEAAMKQAQAAAWQETSRIELENATRDSKARMMRARAALDRARTADARQFNPSHLMAQVRLAESAIMNATQKVRAKATTYGIDPEEAEAEIQKDTYEMRQIKQDLLDLLAARGYTQGTGGPGTPTMLRDQPIVPGLSGSGPPEDPLSLGVRK